MQAPRPQESRKDKESQEGKGQTKISISFKSIWLQQEHLGREEIRAAQEEVEEHLKQTHSDQSKHLEMGGHDRIDLVPMLEVAFTEGEPSFK